MFKRAVPSPPPSERADATTVGRRGMLHGGALLAGAAGAAAVGALSPETARAADGDPLVAGKENAAATTTRLTVGGTQGAPHAPALTLNNADGPALSLEALPADWAGELAVGELAGSELGPVVGVDTVNGTATTYLATGMDLANIPTPFATDPSRRLDLRTSAGRASIIRQSSAGALAPDGKLRAGQWIDIGLIPTAPEYSLEAVFANLTVIRATSYGYAVLYPPGVRPYVSSINFFAGQTVGNASFIGAGAVLGYHAVRLYSTVDAWYVLDVTGGVTSGTSEAPLDQAAAVRRNGGRRAVIGRLRAALTRASR